MTCDCGDCDGRSFDGSGWLRLYCTNLTVNAHQICFCCCFLACFPLQIIYTIMSEPDTKVDTAPPTAEGQGSRRRRGGGEKTCYNCGKVRTETYR